MTLTTNPTRSSENESIKVAIPPIIMREFYALGLCSYSSLSFESLDLNECADFLSALKLQDIKISAAQLAVFHEIRHDFSGLDLRGIDPSALCANGYCFNGAQIDTAQFNALIQDGCRDFTKINISSVVLNREFRFVRFDGIALSMEQFRAFYRAGHRDFQGLDFSEMKVAGLNLSGVRLDQAQFEQLYTRGRRDFNGADLSGTDITALSLRGVSLNDVHLGDDNWHRLAEAASHGRLELSSEQLQGLYYRFDSPRPEQVVLYLNLIKQIILYHPSLQVLPAGIIRAFLDEYQVLRQQELFKWSDFGAKINAIGHQPLQSLCIMRHYLEKKQANDLSARTVKTFEAILHYP